MFDHVMIVNVLFAGIAAVFGLCSRSLLAALLAGILVGLVHAGIVVLVGLQAGSLTLSELPYLKDGVDMAMATLSKNAAHFTFANARYIAYLVGAGVVLFLIVIAGWIVRTLLVLMGFSSQHTVQA